MAEAYGDVQATPTADCDPELPTPAADAALTRAVEDDEADDRLGFRLRLGQHLTVTVPARGRTRPYGSSTRPRT